MTPIIKPIRIICFCSIRPVACANAFGGVEIGSTMASDEPKATPISRVETPPKAAKFSAADIPAKARIGISKLAVAVCEMKFAMA